MATSNKKALYIGNKRLWLECTKFREGILLTRINLNPNIDKNLYAQ